MSRRAHRPCRPPAGPFRHFRRPAGLLRLATALLCLAAWLRAAPPAGAGELEGVKMPDTHQIAGRTLRLNGMGIRTFSFLDIRVYVAGLYLEQPSRDPEAILASPQMKMIDVVFLHDASAERVRDAWMDGFREDCRPPCRLKPEQVAEFLAAVPELRKGDTSRMLFAPDRVEIGVNGRVLGMIRDPDFMRTILATYLGPHPPTEQLKRGLLGIPK